MLPSLRASTMVTAATAVMTKRDFGRGRTGRVCVRPTRISLSSCSG